MADSLVPVAGERFPAIPRQHSGKIRHFLIRITFSYVTGIDPRTIGIVPHAAGINPCVRGIDLFSAGIAPRVTAIVPRPDGIATLTKTDAPR